MKVYERRRRKIRGIWKLPEDILVSHVFMNLPATSVLAVRRVCKPWRRLTTSPSFVRAHTRRHCDDVAAATKSFVVQFYPSPFSQLCRVDADADTNQMCERSIEISLPPNYRIDYGFFLEASCDGLLCFRPMFYRSYYICNPVTKTMITVADSSPDRPNSCVSLKGFYFHRPTNEYRLLQYFIRGKAYKPQETFVAGFEVVTVKGTTWRTVYERLCINGVDGKRKQATKLDNALAANDLRTGAVMANGNLHWVLKRTSQLGMVVFDTNTEKFKEMNIPSQCMQVAPNILLNEIGGKLCIGLKADLYVEEMDIWLMKDYQKQQWTKLHKLVSEFGITGRMPKADEEIKEEIKIVMRWRPGDKRLSLCDFKRNIFSHLHVSQLQIESIVQGYTPSLVEL